jgi:hypothetical protein
MLEAVSRPAALRPSGTLCGGAKIAGVGVGAAWSNTWLHRKLAIVLDEDEDVADGFRRRRRGENHVPGEVATIRFDLAQGRNSGRIEAYPELAQSPQLAQE